MQQNRFILLPIIYISYLCSFKTKVVQSSREYYSTSNLLNVEAKLLNDLFANYTRSTRRFSRPINDSSKPIKVFFGIRLMKVELDEKHQKMKTSVWLRVKWYDESLKWNPTAYKNITSLTVPYSQVWLPDIVLVNTDETEKNIRNADLQVRSSGSVFWSPHVSYESACLIDVTNYPFDKHDCDMWFQSMSISKKKLDLNVYKYKNSSAFDLDTYLGAYKESQEWEIISNSTELVIRAKSKGVMIKFSKRPAIKFSLALRRRNKFKMILLTLPSVCLSSLALCIFLLPPDRADRHSLGMSVFASYIVLLLILIESAPPSAASIPKLGLFYISNIALVIGILISSIISVSVSRRGDSGEDVPSWMIKVFVYKVSRVLMLRNQMHASFNKSRTSNDDRKSNDLEMETIENLTDLDKKFINFRWRNISMVLDRLFALIFIVFFISLAILLFPHKS
ncbi:DgyrCDS13410 [Dimorphilus gyrociliatus]|uniref:DgyrCDS13410 n=1 Tax=Dimorphilus gyrociliatus TaxID=2664684 RepID=A0A7I8WAK4_9ANNE|nr:DgyrCDS13410 [Dimorphilus gyrociliatus]